MKLSFFASHMQHSFSLCTNLKRVIPFTCWAFKLKLKSWIVIRYKFNNNKLSFFTSHTKLSFPICTLFNMKLFFFASHIKCSFSLCINLKESVSPFTCWIFKLILKTWFVIQHQFQYQTLLLYSMKGTFPLCSNQKESFHSHVKHWNW